MAMKIHRHSRGCKTMKIQRPEFGGPLLPRLLPLLLLLLPTRIPATALYFPQSDLSLRLPYPRSNAERFASSIELFELRTLRNDSVEARNTSYRISVPRGELASINLDTKRVFLHRLPREGSATVTIVILARETANSEAVLEMKIWPVPVDGEGLDCADYVEDMCFWRTSRYRIYENQPDTMIGTLRPNVYKDLCPSFHVIGYKLLNGTEYFHIVNDTLFAKESLDRDTVGPPGGPGPRASVQVQCVVWEEVTGRQHAPIKTLDIDVLDQDDNPPTLQGNRSVAITLRDFVAGDKLDEDNLILKDADTRSSNRYTVRILGDAHDALNVTCDVLPIEPPGRAPYTAIYTRIYAKTTLLPKSPYRVILQAKDESLIPGYGENTLNVTVTLFGPEHRTTTTTVSSISTTRRPISYPPSVKIARIASRFARVARPFGGKPHSSLSFAVDGSKGAFDVTRKGGIVYVADEKLLETEAATWTLNLKWSGKDRVEFRGAIRINVMDVPPSKIGACDRNESLVRSCANAERPEDCESRCGVASGALSKGTFAGQCVWRWNKRSNVSQMSEHYQTCSPDLAHCPDNECDELEELDPRVCPQDCTIESNLHFGIANKGGRGIKSGLGTCACSDDLQCTCNVDRFRTRNENVGKVGREEGGRVEKPRDRENEILVSGARKATGGPCGPICVAGVIGASFFVLVVIVGSLVTSRYRMATKGARREGKRRVEGGPNGTGILPSDYIDRGDGLLIGLDTFATTNPRLLPSKTCPLDPKWEFPRSRLTIEQVLGEGEFGRVLRAKAIDIGGSSGATTVAVKTLKENACASELTDLLSEYQLLKEAQHPNVIRLLGACTTPGGPVYLVIEFAEFGSLRNYLRRSRHLESDGRSDSCAANLLSSNVGGGQRNTDAVPTSTYTVAPRDILSFAWQISKGMAYLADIKLVHRDLAARNVLLATGKVCKISDFGLTRDVYEDDAYLKRSKGRVPVKWMAPESLADHVYTSKSDVWSFGVLLWELVTLGASPYPGIDVHNLYNLLKAGYRMERPANCSPQLYKLMVSCWHQEPASRPSFKELTCHWERMLEDGVEYLDLNPRTVHNQAYFTTSPFPSSEDRPCAPVENDGRDNDEVDVSRTDVVNYLGKPSLDTMTKSDKVDKLGTLWREPVGSFPEDASKMSYVNDRPSSEQRANHYESPIKLRNSSVTSSSENDLVTPTYERPRSYIDMEGKKLPEAEDLLVFNSMDDRNDQDEGN